MIIESKEQETRLMGDQVLDDSEQILMAKIREINLALKNERDPDKLLAYGNALGSWLGAIEKLRRLRNEKTD